MLFGAAAFATGATVTLRYDMDDLEVESVGGGDLISVSEGGYSSRIGEPRVPLVTVQLLLPETSDSSAELEFRVVSRETLPGTYDIPPAPEPRQILGGERNVGVERDLSVYGSDRPYPAAPVELAHIGSLRGYRLASLQVFPVEYVPATGHATLLTEISVTITSRQIGASGGRLLPRVGSDRLGREIVRASVANPEDLEEYTTRAWRECARAETTDFLVICPDAFSTSFERLVSWKMQKGCTAELLTTGEIFSTPEYDGIDGAEEIRNCITDYYLNKGLKWVLLGGDTDEVPVRLAYDFFNGQGIPCDLYYSDLDGTWDDDSDGQWGEVVDDAIDMYADVFVGRAPVSDTTQARRFVDRTLAYEGADFSVEDDYQLNMVFLGEVMWDDPDPYTDGGVALDMIDSLYVPGRFDPITKLYESDSSLDHGTAMTALNGGAGIIVHEGHAGTGSLSIGPDALDRDDMDGLSNGDRGGVFYSVGCFAANLDGDSIGEHWVNSPTGGGAAFVGNSRYGWGCPGYPGECCSDLLSQQFVRAMLVDDLDHAGLVHADAKHYYVGVAATDDYMRYCLYELNLLGDPEMALWTDVPRQVELSVPDTVQTSEHTAAFEVTVVAEGAPVCGATVCVHRLEGDSVVRTTDEFGVAAFELPLDFSEAVTLVVTAQNCVPQEASVVLLMIDQWAASTDGALGDTGKGEGVSWVDHDGDGDLDLYFSNDGSANRLLRNDGVGNFTEDASTVLTDLGHGLGVSWGDYDNDGEPDLMLARLGDVNKLFRNEGSGTFEDVSALLPYDLADSRCAVWVDYDNDGFLDIYVVNEGAANHLIHNDGGNGFVLDTLNPVLEDPGDGVVAAWADYDNDGNTDFYLANAGSPNRLFRNLGNGLFADATSGTPLGDAGVAGGAAWADYDNDADLDLYLSNRGSANRLFRNDGGGVFVDVTSAPLDDMGDGAAVSWADVDLDGDIDLYSVVRDGPNALYRNLGDGSFAATDSAAAGDTGSGRGAAWGDCDGDGDPDLYLCNSNGANTLLRNGHTGSNSWLVAALEGVASNRYGIGARVRVVTSGKRQVRQVTGGSGYASQDSPAVMFGMGSASAVDTLEIQWPGGTVDRYYGIPCCERLEFVEDVAPSSPAGLVASPAEAAVELSWRASEETDLWQYRVERDTTSAFMSHMIVTCTADTSCTDFPLVDERPYHYRVVAVDEGLHESDPSEVVVCTPMQTPPPPPSELMAVADESSISLSWSPPASPDLESYVVERDLTSAFGVSTETFQSVDAEFIDSPLEQGASFFYRVFSVDVTGLYSEPSDTVNACVMNVPPSRPDSMSALPAINRIDLHWAGCLEPDVVGYSVYRDTVPSMSVEQPIAIATSSDYGDSACESYTLYWYCVAARDEGGLEGERGDTVCCCALPPDGAVFVDASNVGFESGVFDHPYNTVSEGIAHASSPQSVLVMPGEYSDAVVMKDGVGVFGLGGSAETIITGPVSAVSIGANTRLVGVTVDRLGVSGNAMTATAASPIVEDCVFRRASTGVTVSGGAQATFSGCEFYGNNVGVSVADSSRPVFSRCVFDSSLSCHVFCTGAAEPVLGGSLDDACDFRPGPPFMVFNNGTSEVSAEYCFWGGVCFDPGWYTGFVDYAPWTDASHAETYTECPTSVDDGDTISTWSLGDNFPNPFNPTTQITYDVPSPGARVVLQVYSPTGKLVRTLKDSYLSPGRYSSEWDGRDGDGAPVSSGVYLYRIRMGDFSDQRKMVLLK